MRAFCVVLMVACGLGCGLVDPERPVPYPDEPVYGNLLEVEQVPGEARWTVRVRPGVPRALSHAKEAEGRATPVVEKGMSAVVEVGESTVVLAGGRPAEIEKLSPGTEVVVLPMAGTTTMVGGTTIQMTASYLLDFDTYRRWRLPNLVEGEDATEGAEPEGSRRVNTAALETSPVPLAGGRVLYFSSRLRLPVEPSEPLIGPRRPGLEPAGGGATLRERTYRTERSSDGWSEAELVVFPGLDEVDVARVTWVNEEETVSLVTVRPSAEPPWLGRATRASASAAWSPVEPLRPVEEGYAEDGTYLAGSKTKYLFVARPPAAIQTDLVLFDPKLADLPQLLAPNVNTAGDEWCPRVGPVGQLLFCRGDHQLLLAGGTVRPLRLPGPHRRLLSQANPTRDGKWVFFCMPRFTPVELDQDLFVAPWGEDGTLGEPVAVDDWTGAS